MRRVIVCLGRLDVYRLLFGGISPYALWATHLMCELLAIATVGTYAIHDFEHVASDGRYLSHDFLVLLICGGNRWC